MIEISQISEQFLGRCVDAPGGFAWWYLDVCGADGRGVVLIWSWGLPFLPKSREGARGRDRPALCLVAHNAEGPTFYLFQEYCAAQCSEPSWKRGRMGESRFGVRRNGALELIVDLDAPLPSSDHHLRGKIVCRGNPTRVSTEPSIGDPVHAWMPQAAHASAEASLSWGEEEQRFSGSAYFDQNASPLPLHDQNIARWRWGRASFPDHTLIYYWVQDPAGGTSTRVLRVDEGGAAVPVVSARIEFVRQRAGIYGVDAATELRITSDEARYDLSLKGPIDDGPFYERFILDAAVRTSSGLVQRGNGLAEELLPTRIDQPWQRPFVSMKVHRPERDNSVWLPLFSGAAEDRADRFARSLLSWGRH